MDGHYGPQKIDYTKLGEPGVETIDASQDNEQAHLSHGGGVYFEHLAFLENTGRGARRARGWRKRSGAR